MNNLSLQSVVYCGWDFKRGYSGKSPRGVRRMAYEDADFKLIKVTFSRGNIAGWTPSPTQGSRPVRSCVSGDITISPNSGCDINWLFQAPLSTNSNGRTQCCLGRSRNLGSISYSPLSA